MPRETYKSAFTKQIDVRLNLMEEFKGSAEGFKENVTSLLSALKEDIQNPLLEFFLEDRPSMTIPGRMNSSLIAEEIAKIVYAINRDEWTKEVYVNEIQIHRGLKHLEKTLSDYVRKDTCTATLKHRAYFEQFDL